jgi:hypothetical protein
VLPQAAKACCTLILVLWGQRSTLEGFCGCIVPLHCSCSTYKYAALLRWLVLLQPIVALLPQNTDATVPCSSFPCLLLLQPTACGRFECQHRTVRHAAHA